VLARIRSHLQNQALVQQLSDANTEKNKFLGMCAHDLRNPLASIRGLTEFLGEGSVGPLTPEQKDLIDTIHSASQSMLVLVNELLDVAAIEAGELKLHLEAEDLATLIGKSVALMNMEAAKKKTCVNSAPAKIAQKLVLDTVKMRQVIDNLLSNAIKYSSPGSTITVTLAVDAAHGTCAFAVQDQGPGIPEDERDRLFKDFSRLSVKPTGGEKSTGLGLAIC
jgi:signal transduction histidine kinase